MVKKEAKMIVVEVRFWTDDIPKKGALSPKHAWTSGMVRVRANKLHGIKSSRPKAFNSLLDLGQAIEKTILATGVKLHVSRGMKKYVLPLTA
jgi:hypothetical protein